MYLLSCYRAGMYFCFVLVLSLELLHFATLTILAQMFGAMLHPVSHL